MRAGTVLALCLLLGGCVSLWRVGEDPNGVRAKAQADRIVAALQRFHSDKGHWPDTLGSLTPEYIAALPPNLWLHYEPSKDFLTFQYSPSWPSPGQVTCRTNLGAQAWDCSGYI
jgi:hypothetical protein